MSTFAPDRPRPLAESSAAPGLRGWPWWAAVLVALVCTLVGTAIDGWVFGTFSWGLRLGFWAGVALAALLVQRRSVFTAMVQPPLILVAGLLIGGLLFINGGGMYGMALKLIATFPTMAIGTALAVAIGLIRIVAQPLRRPARTTHAADAQGV